MYFIQDSKDILYLALSFGVLLLSVLTAWFIYYLVMMIREVFKMTKEIDELIKTVKEKIDNSASYLFLIGEGIKKLVEVAKDYNSKRAKKTVKKKK